MKTKQQKSDSMIQLKDKISHSKMTVFTSYAREGDKGLDVSKMRDLKKNLRMIDGEYLVAKKTIIDRALKPTHTGNVNVFSFSGSLGLAFGNSDEAIIAKTLYGFARTNPSLKLLGALMGSGFINAVQFIELAKLPAKEVMIGRAVGMIKYPLSSLMNVMQANMRNLVIVLSAIQNK